MPKKLRVIIADDEKSSRDIIENYVTKYCQNIEIVARAKDAREAIELINTHTPDLVFLDVEMPFGNAFDVLEQTEDVDYQTIFITAYSDYAIKALNYSAAYYILKPISIDELVAAVEKVRAVQEDDNLAQLKKVLKLNLGNDGIQRIVLPNQQGFEIVHADDIIRISGSGNYSDLYLKSGEKKTVSKILKYFENLQENTNFVRIHKSHIINTDHISAYKKGRGGSVVLSNGNEVEVSVSMKGELMKVLGL
ncbi:MAG: LytTR family DNA-binding domain-containing protein [Bacteroidia bacterium]|jgi:two-component system LytT family response regulator|nr:DNA-binding response regulator [Bacteroidota bacterium]|tara:strand:+ start:4970 stop:5719 length:750 start_codon:yes stop_codon:yes gene_type:complete